MTDETKSCQKAVVLFGDGHWAEYVAYILENDSENQVAGFTLDGAHMRSDKVFDRPAVAFENIGSVFPPSQFKLLIAAGFVEQNKLRADRYLEAKALGYDFVSYVSSKASVWANTKIGENVTIHENAIVQPFCRIGDDSHILSGANISHHSYIGNHCFVAGSVAIGGGCRIGDFCFLGMNSTIKNDVSITSRVTVGAGATVVHDLDVPGTYVGSPARLMQA